MFDDALLESRTALAGADDALRRLARAGARVRIEYEQAEPLIDQLRGQDRPRAVIAAGTDARLIRALLEPACPVPFVAWPNDGLPGWVGALDLVIVLASDASDLGLVATVHEAVRRGASLVVACPERSIVADHAGSSATTLLPTTTGDRLAAAVVVLAGLHLAHLGPGVDPAKVADAMDKIAEDCSPFVDIASNPAKDLALGLAESQPLVWGGSVLAARASRRIAEALRAASGRPALAADAEALLPVLMATEARDPFADPFEDADAERRPTLIVLDDGNSTDVVRAARGRLVTSAERTDVRVCVLGHEHGSDVERYAALLLTGQFAAVYLAVGLGHYRG